MVIDLVDNRKVELHARKRQSQELSQFEVLEHKGSAIGDLGCLCKCGNEYCWE